MKVLRFLCLFIIFTMRNISADDFNEAAFLVPSNGNEWQEQKLFFQKNGYLWIKDFFSEEQVALIQSWAHDINQSAQSLLKLTQNNGPSLKYLQQTIPGSLIVVPESNDPSQVCRAEDLLSCYPDLYDFTLSSVTVFIVRLLEEPYVLFKDKLNFKWPGGGAFLPHQDFPAYEPFAPREHVTVMISVDPATLENGCLHVAKNWQKTFLGDPVIDPEHLEMGRAVLPYNEGGKGHGSIQAQYAEKMTWHPLETSPRDLVLINSFVPHYSEPNKSQNSRRAMFFTHNRLEEGEFRSTYYRTKRQDPDNPVFHFATPTKARTK